MKKFLVIVLCLALCFSFAGCGCGDNATGNEENEKKALITQVEKSSFFSLGLTEEGKVLVCGEPKFKTLTATNGLVYVDVDGWSEGIVKIDTGVRFAMGLKEDGTVVVAVEESNEKYDLSEWTDITDIAAGGNHWVGLKKDGTVVAGGGNDYGECDVEDWEDVVKIFAGADVTVGVQSDGTVLTTGRSSVKKQIKSWTDIVAMEIESDFAIGVKKDGSVVCTEEDFDYSNIVDVKLCRRGAIFFLTEDGNVIGVDTDDFYLDDQVEVEEWENVKMIDTESGSIIALTEDGEILTAGDVCERYDECLIPTW